MDSSAAAPGPRAGTGERPLSAADFVVLGDEIRAFVRAGIPLEVGLRGTAGRCRGALRSVSQSLARRLEMGDSLEEALAEEEGRLPAAYRAVLTAGLQTGRLDEVLQSLSELTESTTSLRRQLRLSLIYPAIIFIVAYGLFAGFVLYLVPQLQRTYQLFQLPDSIWVRALLWLHRTLEVWAVALPAIVAGVVFVTWVMRRLVRSRSEGLVLARWVPGGRDLSLARFARVLSLLVRHEVPLPMGCRLSGQAAGNDRIRRQSEQVAAAVESGRPLREAIESAAGLPSFLRWLIVVGDRQGGLADSLRQAAEVYEQRALTKLEWFRRIIPPLLVIGCAGTITLLYGLTLFVPLTELMQRMGTM